ncbi:MAG: thiamine biosynthesis protein ThiS [Rickettsiales bacterium]|nr:thiamine biosynthesis protein ThiS [Rickettsiales bacterium]
MKNKNEYTINGRNIFFEESDNTLDFIIKKFLKEKVAKNIAVAVNDELVQKSDWKNKIINFGDRIEIVYPFNGG